MVQLPRNVPNHSSHCVTDAIEDSTQDLWIWLHRHGKNMVGEWVIMWINEVRDEWRLMKVPRFHTFYVSKSAIPLALTLFLTSC